MDTGFYPLTTHTHTHPFNGPLSRTTQVSWYQKGKTNLDFTQARDSEWQWHQLGKMQICTSLQTNNHASTPLLSFFTGRMPFLPPNQQRQSTEGNSTNVPTIQSQTTCNRGTDRETDRQRDRETDREQQDVPVVSEVAADQVSSGQS